MKQKQLGRVGRSGLKIGSCQSGPGFLSTCPQVYIFRLLSPAAVSHKCSPGAFMHYAFRLDGHQFHLWSVRFTIVPSSRGTVAEAQIDERT